MIDLAAQQVTRQGRPVHLTPTEVALLRELVINRGKLLTHAQLLRRVWGHGYETETEYVRVYVRLLRAKLEPDGGPPLILTQPRAGRTGSRRNDLSVADTNHWPAVRAASPPTCDDAVYKIFTAPR